MKVDFVRIDSSMDGRHGVFPMPTATNPCVKYRRKHNHRSVNQALAGKAASTVAIHDPVISGDVVRCFAQLGDQVMGHFSG